MEVRDYSAKLDQARDRYREAQEDLKSSYDKNLDDLKSTYEAREKKQARNYNEQKLKLEEQNLINNENYSVQTKEAIAKKQEDFKNRLRNNTGRFEDERNNLKQDFKEKLDSLSTSYQKSTEENNRFNEQTKKIMGERYKAANDRYSKEFNEKIAEITDKTKLVEQDTQLNARKERSELSKRFENDLESMRSSNSEQKFKEVSRLRGDIENLRTTHDRERDMIGEQHEERIAEMMKNKNKEIQDNHQNFETLQDGIRQKNLATQEKQALDHKVESKQLEERFSDDLRNIQRVATQKMKGGTQADNLNDELRQTKSSYENRLQTARKEMDSLNRRNTEKEMFVDKAYREKLKTMKTANVENLERKQHESDENLKKTVYELRDRNNAAIDRYKGEIAQTKTQADEKLNELDSKNENRFKEQRVEFGKVVNTLNEKNMSTIASLKEDFSKDKSESIERSKKEFNDEKVQLKTDFNRQIQLKESNYEQRLAQMEKQTQKIIENYENRISQIVRKADREVEAIKVTEHERKIKENQAQQIHFENMTQAHRTELLQLRDKYENVVARDRVQNEQHLTQIVQKYEDQLDRERKESQKELSIKLSEAQAQLERLYRSSEQEKQNIRAQSEAKVENLKLAMRAQENSKKA